MRTDCGILILVFLCLASFDLSRCRPMQQRLESDGQESEFAGGKDITYEAGFTVQTVLDGSKSNVSIYGTFPAPDKDYIYAIDMQASQVLKIKLPVDGKQVGVVAGSDDGEAGHKDGWGKSALFNHPRDLTVDDEGNVYLADVRNNVIRKINPDGAVSTIAGQSNVTGFADGEGREAHFSADFGVTYVPGICSLLVSDRGNRRLRLIQLKKPEVCSFQSASFSVGLEGLFFVISGTIVMSTITIVALQSAKVGEKLHGLQLVIANRLRWRQSGDELLTPLQSGGLPQLPSSTQTNSLPAIVSAERLPDLIDLSYETPTADVPRQTPRITDGADSTRGRDQDPSAQAEPLPDTPGSSATSLVSDRDQGRDSEKLRIEYLS